MSPVPSRLRPRAAVPAGALLLALAAAAPAAAQVPSTGKITAVEQPIAAPGGSPSIGNGVTTWLRAVDATAGKPDHFEVWTMRDGAPVLAATLPNRLPGKDEALRDGALEIEAGTLPGGVPAAVVRTPGSVKQYRRALDRTYLVRLDTGARRRLPSKIDGLPVYGTGLDAGRLFYAVGRERPKDGSTSSLWRATASTAKVGKPAKLRTSRRSSVWFGVLADRGRVAVEANEPAEGSYYENSYLFGAPKGTWRRAARIAVYDGPIPQHGIAGFTKDGRALVTFLTSDDQREPTQLTRTPVAKGGKETTVGFGIDGEHTTARGALDAETGRILTFGPDASGTDVFGYSAVAFPPGG